MSEEECTVAQAVTCSSFHAPGLKLGIFYSIEKLVGSTSRLGLWLDLSKVDKKLDSSENLPPGA